ncbi:serine hydrolase domain-containing protein [Phenylobacterium sp.]|uniref:serine hydrolase domain-containing protein n=1 Tax=Phenylobacterium sp. TaxID=1871053 RepID=UPI00301C56AB
MAIFLAAAAAAMAVPAQAKAQERNQAQERIQVRPEVIDPVFAAYTATAPGCAVGVRRGDGSPVFRAYGAADLERGAPITPDTIFEAGSVSKQFTAAAILLLVEDGKLSLADDIRRHLPEMPDYGRPITVDMLLSHTSGLRDWGELMALAGWPRTSRVYTHAEVLQIAARQRALNFTPGEAYSYTNTGYNLAALIVQRLSGYTLADYTRLRIFEPLGMTRTSWRDNFRRVVPGRAIAYRLVPGGGNGDVFGQDMPFENTYGHGGLLTTVGDLLTWNDALATGRLGPTVYARMQQSPTLTGGRKIAYARGLMNLSADGRAEVSHGGATAGYRAWLARLPAERLSVALLCNRGDANPAVLGRRVVEAVAPSGRRPDAAAPAPAADLQRLPGVYVDERSGGVLVIAARAGGLEVAGGGPVARALRPAPAGGEYTAEGVLYRFGGQGLVLSAPDGGTVDYRRIEPARPTPEDLQALAGAYASSEAGAVLNVGVSGGRLVIAPADRPSAADAAVPLHRDAFRVDGGLVRVLRGPDRRVTGLRFTSGRVHALDFRRIEPP